MGKIPPSMRSSKLPLALIKPSASLPQQSRNPPHKPKIGPSKKPSSKKTLSSGLTPIVFKSPNLSDARKTFDSFLSFSQVPLPLSSLNALLQSFCNVSTLQDSVSFLHHMKHKIPSFSPNHSTYHILLTQSCQGEISTIHKVLELMVDNGIPPNNASLDVVMRSLCSLAREDDACELLKELSVKYTPPDAFTFNFVVRRLCKTHSLSTVYEFIKEMQNVVKPDLVTYTILIDVVCNKKDLREATRLLGILKDAGFKPDCYLYNTIMKGYCMLDHFSETMGVYKAMKEEGVEPDLVTYNTLIFALSKVGRVEEARNLLDFMVEIGHFPDAVTYTSLMNGMCRKGNALGAVALLEEMQEKGCSPNSCTYNTLLHGLSKGKHLDRGMELYDLMKSEGMELEAAAYATFVRFLCRDDKIAEAYEVFEYAIQSKSLTDVAAYSALETSLKWVKKLKG
ncbi:hypothetical protein ACLOJK_018298 [Asimina triloba]